MDDITIYNVECNKLYDMIPGCKVFIDHNLFIKTDSSSLMVNWRSGEIIDINSIVNKYILNLVD